MKVPFPISTDCDGHRFQCQYTPRHVSKLGESGGWVRSSRIVLVHRSRLDRNANRSNSWTSCSFFKSAP